MHIDLRCGKANALCLVHGFDHVGHQGAQGVIKLCDGFGHRMQTGVGIAKDV